MANEAVKVFAETFPGAHHVLNDHAHHIDALNARLDALSGMVERIIKWTEAFQDPTEATLDDPFPDTTYLRTGAGQPEPAAEPPTHGVLSQEELDEAMDQEAARLVAEIDTIPLPTQADPPAEDRDALPPAKWCGYPNCPVAADIRAAVLAEAIQQAWDRTTAGKLADDIKPKDALRCLLNEFDAALAALRRK